MGGELTLFFARQSYLMNISGGNDTTFLITIKFSLRTHILTIVTVGSLKILELPVKAEYNLLFT